MDIKGKKVTVVGLGNSGVNAAILLAQKGASVRATEAKDNPATRAAAKLLSEKGAEVEIGVHTEKFIRGSELVVLSPGVEDSSPSVKWAEGLRIPIISEMELGYRFCEGKIIAITGTNGKSTVTTLIGQMLKDGGKDSVVCGNIGNSLSGEIGRIKADTWVVLEVSSFQLERVEKFRPRIALILNITDDHMDRYKKFDDYFNEKLKVFRNQDKGDILILNHDAENLRSLQKMARCEVLFYSRTGMVNGAYVKSGRIFSSYGSGESDICAVSDIRLKGLHNVENVLASSLVGTIAGVGSASIKRTLTNFKGLAHRFETVDIIDGVEYIDDSKGTTVDSTCRALESCAKPVVLIAGGKDKHSDYSFVRDAVKRNVSYLVLIGEASEAIGKALGNIVDTRRAKDMFEAVDAAAGIAKNGQIVLLSPMCSSFDMFSSYKERGDVFREAVKRLRNSQRKIKINR